MRSTEVPVAIVGAGASGLAVAASLQKLGRSAVVFEADERIGATWERRYDRLHLHTVRRFSGLPLYAIPRSYPRYVPKDLYAEYLAEYAAQLGLDVQCGRRIDSITRVDRERPLWSLKTAHDAWSARVVVVATGRHHEQRLPPWPGLDDFSGRFLHSGDYRSARDFTGLDALVIGLGNSGAEIAAELVETEAKRVVVAVRTPPPITPREIFGVPVQLFGIALAPISPTLVDRIGAVMRRIGTGDLRRYGLGAAAWGPFTARRPPVIDVGFLRQLKAGRVEVRGEVVRFSRSGVVFADGQEERFDVVVAATGFATGLEHLVEAQGALDERGYPRRPEADRGLFFAGYHESPRGQLYEANRQSGRLARAIDLYLQDRHR